MTTQEITSSLITILQEQYVALEYDKTNKVLIQTWYDFAPSEVFRKAIDKTVEFVEKNQVYGIISDALQQNVVAKEDAEYAASVMPVLRSAGLVAMAFVIPQNIFTQMSLKKFEKSQNNAMVEYFTTYKRAENWVLAQIG